MNAPQSAFLATLEPVRFGEFLRDRRLISDEQWLAALAAHWSSARWCRIGDIIVEHGYLPAEVVEAEARTFHDDLDIVEVGVEVGVELESSEKVTVPSMPAVSMRSACSWPGEAAAR